MTAAAKSGTVTAAAAKPRTETKPEHPPEAVGAGPNSKQAASGSHMSSNAASTEPIDKIEQTAVSKVSEVATKTSKPNPALADDGALLTEEQLLKMSDKDYMNGAQLAFFKARLQQLEKDLLKNAGETTEHLRETVLVPDPADRATIEEEHALELRTRDRERKLLKKVQQSIASIDSGDYGWCEETGEPIGIPRLLARPTATLSLEAQQRRELKQKLYGD
jgi:DnaK suppressor protein